MSFQADFDDADAVMSEINMTPLVDVMLVLLIIFIITMPVINQAVKLELPQANTHQIDAKPRHINLSIDATGSIFWDKEMVSKDALTLRLDVTAQEQPQPEIHLRADAKVAYDHVAKFLATAQRAGMSKIAFVTDLQQK